MDIKVFEKGGQLWTTSLEVAEGKNGYVYAVKAKEGYVKIGRTQTPDARIKQIEYQSGHSIVLCAFSPMCSNYIAIESALHNRLRKYNKKGEWFSADFDCVTDAMLHIEYMEPAPMNSPSIDDTVSWVFQPMTSALKKIGRSIYYYRLDAYRMRKRIEWLEEFIETHSINGGFGD